MDSARSSLASTGAKIKNFGMSVNSDGSTSFFATLEKSAAEQTKRLEKKQAEKKAAKAKEKKQTEKKEAEKRLEKAKEKKKADEAYDFLQKDYIDTVNKHKQWEKKILDLVNEQRVAVDLQPVHMNIFLPFSLVSLHFLFYYIQI